MIKTLISILSALALMARAVRANENAVVDAIGGYLEFSEYGSSLIRPEQIPKEDWKKVFVVDARVGRVVVDGGGVPCRRAKRGCDPAGRATSSRCYCLVLSRSISA